MSNSTSSTLDIIAPQEPAIRDLQRLAELGRLSASLLHEISTPLTVTKIYLEELGEKTHPSLAPIWRSINNLHAYVEAAKQQIRHQSSDTWFDVSVQVDQIIGIVGPLARAAHVNLTVVGFYDIRLFGDPVKFQQIVTNLLVNAIEAYDPNATDMSKKPVILKFTSQTENLIIEVIDKGKGINDADAQKLFEPFYSTKTGTHRGLGLGLATVQRYIRENFNGSVEVDLSQPELTIFRIILPLTSV